MEIHIVFNADTSLGAPALTGIYWWVFAGLIGWSLTLGGMDEDDGGSGVGSWLSARWVDIGLWEDPGRLRRDETRQRRDEVSSRY